MQLQQTQTRNADLIKRPKRPYTFTQMVQLSDGSTYTTRTTSPHALYKSTKDTRNHVLWNPSEQKLRAVEVDEAGRLAAFRGRFGRGWDAEKAEETKQGGKEEKEVSAEEKELQEMAAGAKKARLDTSDPLSDLIAGYAAKSPTNQNQMKGLSVKDKRKK
jgi:hypothetical protein